MGHEESAQTGAQLRLEEVDFGLHELPGDALHDVLRRSRERGPIQPTRFLGLPSFVITGYDALLEAFLDEHALPGHRMYQLSFEPAIGKSFISDPDPASYSRRSRRGPALRHADRGAAAPLARGADALPRRPSAGARRAAPGSTSRDVT